MNWRPLTFLVEAFRAKLRQPRCRLLALLGTGSCVAVWLLALRCLLGWQIAHLYLLWNLFLAWVPLGFALLARRCGHSRWRAALCGLGWLLFFPNAPYLMTDLVHLRPRPPVPLWADILLLQLFIWLGLLLGFVSLVEMQRLVKRLLGGRPSWWFVPLTLALAGFGVYLGRFGRWNSWDVLTSPLQLGRQIAARLAEPTAHPRTFGFTLLCFAVLLTAYGILYALMRMGAELSREGHAPAASDSLAEPNPPDSAWPGCSMRS